MNKEVEIHIFGYDYLNDSNKSYPHITQFYFTEIEMMRVIYIGVFLLIHI